MSLVAFLQITSVVGKDYEDEEHVEEEEAADSAENEEDDESQGEIWLATDGWYILWACDAIP